jgi:cytochrome c-type biogenesis protein CcmH/NrfG
MPAVTLVAIFCGVSLLASARDEWAGRFLEPRLRAGLLVATVALGGVAVLGLLGNSAVSASTRAANAGNLNQAESQARRAIELAPWSSLGWRKLGEAQYRGGKVAAARQSFREAVAKEPRDWTLWLELATASRGHTRTHALAEARRLNPRSPELATVSK